MKKYNVQWTVVFLFSAIGISFLQGCSAFILGAGEKAYGHIRGDLLGIVPEPLEKTYSASVEAMENLEGYDVIAQYVNVLEGEVVAYDAKARIVEVDLKKTEHDQTRVSIRIGAMGDKLESVHIYDQIQHHLQTVPLAQNVF